MKGKTEIWRKHPDIDIIEVSSLGRVRSLDRVVSGKKRTQFVKGQVLKPGSGGDGYLKVDIRSDGKRITKYVHRLVAESFIHNPDSLPEINHKDCDKTNNSVDNLEWLTHQENIAYRDKLGHTARNNAPKLPVFAVNLKTLEVLHFRSRDEAGRTLGVYHQNINAVIKGKREQAGGFWFTNDDDNAADDIKHKLEEMKRWIN